MMGWIPPHVDNPPIVLAGICRHCSKIVGSRPCSAVTEARVGCNSALAAVELVSASAHSRHPVA
jgi:hypothetical protein